MKYQFIYGVIYEVKSISIFCMDVNSTIDYIITQYMSRNKNHQK
jgi:hypothetical protein